MALVVFTDRAAGLSFLVAATGLMLGYEWVHYLVHSDHKPVTRAFLSVWRNHRLHHYEIEHYWFTVTTDRLFGTYPDAPDVESSPTVRVLHGG